MPNSNTFPITRRGFNTLSIASLFVLAAQKQALALSLSDITEQEASVGLKQALEQSALSAIGILGKQDGFLANPKVRIALPGHLDEAAKLLSKFGQQKKIDELITGMNRAAEKAIPYSRDLLTNSVREMNVIDAKNILTGGEHSVTDFFAEKTRTPLSTQFLPIVTNATNELSLAKKFNKFAKKASRFGLVKKQDASIEQYVTRKTLDGLYTIIGEQEQALRRDPAGAATDIVRKVFGAF